MKPNDDDAIKKHEYKVFLLTRRQSRYLLQKIRIIYGRLLIVFNIHDNYYDHYYCTINACRNELWTTFRVRGNLIREVRSRL
jgi:hypothetical protein